MNELHQEIAQLRERNEILEAELAAMREVAAGIEYLPLMEVFGLTKQEAMVITLMLDGRIRSNDWLTEHIQRRTYDVGVKLVPAVICKVRKKIAPHSIITHWGMGYSLAPYSIPAIQNIINGGLNSAQSSVAGASL
jgi:DNA-binding response OmpR family regulator